MVRNFGVTETSDQFPQENETNDEYKKNIAKKYIKSLLFWSCYEMLDKYTVQKRQTGVPNGETSK